MSGVRLNFCPCIYGKVGGLEDAGGCLGVHTSASAFFLFPPDFLPPPLVLSPPPPMSSFHSPQLVMSPAASDVKVSQAEGTMELRENVNPGVHGSACVFCGFFLCVLVCVYPFSRVIKDPIWHTHTCTHSPFEPLQRN